MNSTESGLLPDIIINFSSFSVIPFWILLALLPQWKLTVLLSSSFAFPLVISLIYSLSFFASMAIPIPEGQPAGDIFSAEGLHNLFGQPLVAAAAWSHYIAFDMITAIGISNDSLFYGVPRLLVAPCLFGTFMAGPMGLFFYFLVRCGWTRGVPPFEVGRDGAFPRRKSGTTMTTNFVETSNGAESAREGGERGDGDEGEESEKRKENDESERLPSLSFRYLYVTSPRRVWLGDCYLARAPSRKR